MSMAWRATYACAYSDDRHDLRGVALLRRGRGAVRVHLCAAGSLVLSCLVNLTFYA